jgi:translation elongation factor EF-1alpha
MGGQLLYLTGMVDKRTLEKFEKEAKEAGRESWYLSWALDSTPQERAKVRPLRHCHSKFLRLEMLAVLEGFH